MRTTACPATSDDQRILGIDPGLRITGFGVIDKTGSKLELCHQRLHQDAGDGDLADAPEDHTRRTWPK